MKLESQWLQLLAKCGSDHPAACCCDRCKHGVETFLLPSDIADIQRDAREGMVPESDVKAVLLQAEDAIQRTVDITTENRLGWALQSIEALRAKHPNLFTT